MLVEVTLLTLLVGTLIPIAVGIVTKEVAHPGVKASLLALLSAGAGVLNSAVENQGLITKESVVAGFVAFVVAVSSYYGFWKPSTVAGKAQKIAPTKGIG